MSFSFLQVANSAKNFINKELDFLPLITLPAVKNRNEACAEQHGNDFIIDHARLNKRILAASLVALGSLAIGFAVAVCLPQLAVKVMVISLLALSSSMLVSFMESTRASREIGRLCVDEYLTKEHPSKYTTAFIRCHLSAAKLFIRMNGDINKLDSEEQTLLTQMNLRNTKQCSVFRLLVDYSHDKPLVKIKEIFNNAISNCTYDSARFSPLDYLIENRKISEHNFTRAELVSLWTKVDEQQAKVLKKHGFNIDVIDEAGYTPLLRLLSLSNAAHKIKMQHDPLSNRYLDDRLDGIALHVVYGIENPLADQEKPLSKQIKVLLDCGANLQSAVLINGRPTNGATLGKTNLPEGHPVHKVVAARVAKVYSATGQLKYS